MSHARFDALKTSADVDSLSDAEVISLCQWNDPNGEWWQMTHVGLSCPDCEDNGEAHGQEIGKPCTWCGGGPMVAVKYASAEGAPTIADARECLCLWIKEHSA